MVRCMIIRTVLSLMPMVRLRYSVFQSFEYNLMACEVTDRNPAPANCSCLNFSAKTTTRSVTASTQRKGFPEQREGRKGTLMIEDSC